MNFNPELGGERPTDNISPKPEKNARFELFQLMTPEQRAEVMKQGSSLEAVDNIDQEKDGLKELFGASAELALAAARKQKEGMKNK